MLRSRFAVVGRTVFITGAARGIGAESARRLHAAGANVALVGLEPEKLAALAEQLGRRAAWFEADVTDYDALVAAVEGTVARFGSIDVAIANAGLQFMGRMATMAREQFERTIEVNLLGAWRTDRAVLGEIVRNRGYLLNVSSLSAASHVPLMGAYTASKAGVEAMTDALRVELAHSGARVGCAYFGFIDTDLVRGSFAHPSTQQLTAGLPSFISTPAPLSQAIDAIERGVQRRAARVWAPRYVGGALALRGILQPLTEWRMKADKRLPQALELADPQPGDDQHELLGVAARAQPEREPQPPAVAPPPR
ncbi:MAG: 3-oxoacyl-[acyl-carrier protein] reductase [uncultured Solirubrobacteraceae bacterium]|uniref:3-oxoacyl-[acyl-carrier protein] reductase n=1 Tax=uncultured Solirubrobacteraceae bacterium TaxID=1162706 RepID=A0A6J4SKY9_9ACTN|nr:MAG: 3-oxoacyl-[acyl-carrier protein] reductase [uncultured Solirubrobacteraceae bacterium]